MFLFHLFFLRFLLRFLEIGSKSMHLTVNVCCGEFSVKLTVAAVTAEILLAGAYMLKAGHDGKKTFIHHGNFKVLNNGFKTGQKFLMTEP